MIVLAIDPGNIDTAYCVYDTDDEKILEAGKVPNGEMLNICLMGEQVASKMVIEMIACYGMTVGKSVFDTCVWIGRFIQAWEGPECDQPWETMFRREVKMHLCNTNRAKDKNVNRVLLDRFGDWTHGKTGKGTKENPGPLYGFNNDMFAALGVAVTYAETRLN
jgi:hypothetical protein